MTSETTTPSEPSYRSEHTEGRVIRHFPSPSRFLRAFLPEETVKHLYAARREQLLALRSIVDAALERVDAAEKDTPHRTPRRFD
jgi:hypothetical protein